jgi:hypothetical protein
MNKFQPQGKMKIIKGTILAPENAGLRFVLSVNNVLGKVDGDWYKVFDKRWRRVKEDAKGWFNTRTGAYKLGAVNTTAVQSDTWVIHMLCQDDKLVTDVKGLEECLKKVCSMAKYEKATVHVPSAVTEAVPEMTEMLSKHLVDNGVSVYFYEEPA